MRFQAANPQARTLISVLETQPQMQTKESYMKHHPDPNNLQRPHESNTRYKAKVFKIPQVICQVSRQSVLLPKTD